MPTEGRWCGVLLLDGRLAKDHVGDSGMKGEQAVDCVRNISFHFLEGDGELGSVCVCEAEVSSL